MKPVHCDFRMRASGLARVVVSWTVVAVLVLVALGWNPLTSLERRPEWSVCGQDLCTCVPVNLEPMCPLCPGAGAGPCADESARSGSSLGRSGGALPLRWVPDRFDERIPMAIELVAVSLVLPIGGGATPPALAHELVSFVNADRSEIPATQALETVTPPPRRRA